MNLKITYFNVILGVFKNIFSNTRMIFLNFKNVRYIEKETHKNYISIMFVYLIWNQYVGVKSILNQSLSPICVICLFHFLTPRCKILTFSNICFVMSIVLLVTTICYCTKKGSSLRHVMIPHTVVIILQFCLYLQFQQLYISSNINFSLMFLICYF